MAIMVENIQKALSRVPTVAQWVKNLTAVAQVAAEARFDHQPDTVS